MKKNCKFCYPGIGWQKLFRIMRLSVILLFAGMMQVTASVYSQATKLSVEARDKKVVDVLKTIEEQSEFRFFYKNEQVDVNRRIDMSANNKPVEEILDNLFQGTNVTYKLFEDKLILLSTKEAAEAELKNIQEQQKTVTGKVTDKNGDTMPGVTVLIKGTTNGTITDIDGNYIISNITDGVTLQFSFIGMKSQEIVVAGQTSINVTMVKDAIGLEEVVAVGYGVQKKVNLTGSVATVDSKMLDNRPMSNVSAGLSGLLPGVYVKQSSGMPGNDGGTIRIRGTGTLNNSAPMVIVDGVESSMSELSPEDIGSISVLKDAASAAIYGSKAANGVILITTKKGKEGAPVVKYSGDFGWQAPTDLPEFLGSADYAELYNEALENEGKSMRFSDEDIALFRNGTDPFGHPDTDWLDMLYAGSGFQTSHNISLSGGTQYTTYRTKVNYQKQEGIVEHTGKDRYNVRTNITSNPYKWLSSNVNLSYTRQTFTEPNNAYVGGGIDQIIRQAYRISPWIPYKDEDGTYGTISDGNPIAWLDQGEQINKKQWG